MIKSNFSFLKLPALLVVMLLVVASCARSPYNFVKVDPKKPFDRVTPATAGTQVTIDPATLSYSSGRETPAQLNGHRLAPTTAPANESRTVYTSRRSERKAERRQAREKKAQTRRIVKRELGKSTAFGALPAKKLKKVEKIISKQTSRIAKKKAASPAPIGFNQWMKIGVILLLVGLVVGIAFADLGYIVAVIGIVFLVLGLIQQI